MRRPKLFRGLLLAVGIVACSSSPDRFERTSQTEEELGSACTSHTLRISDLHADFRDIWAGRESADTGKQGEPNEQVVIDFSATVDPSRLAAQFVPTVSDGSCGGSIAATVTGSVIATNVWGTTSTDSARPTLPAPYQVLARESISGVVSAAGALAAGGDINLTSMSINGTVQQPVGLIAGGKANLANGSVQGNVTFGVASTFPQTVTISGTKTLQPFSVDSAFQNLETLSSLLNEESATGSVQSSNGTITLASTKSGLNVFQLSADALQQASNVVISTPAGAGVLVNVSGANIAIQNKGFTLTGVSAGGLLWNFPNASFLQISSVGLSGSLLAPLARLSFDSGSITGTLAVRNFASSGSGSLLSAPLSASLLLGSASPTAVALAPAQPLLRGCVYQFTVSASSALTAGGNCLTAALSVPFRVAPHASDAASRELAGAIPDLALKTLRRFAARPGINTPVADVLARYESAIGVSRAVLVPVGAPRLDTIRTSESLTTYQQYHLGYPIAGFGYLVASEAGIFRSAGGSVAKNLPSTLPAPVSQTAAVQSAVQFQHISNPPWVSNPTKFHAPSATLELMPQNSSPANASDFRLTWVVGMLGTGVPDPATFEVDAATGAVLGSYTAKSSQTGPPPPAFLATGSSYLPSPATVQNSVDTLDGDGQQTINVARYQLPNSTDIVTTLSNGQALTAGSVNTQYQGFFTPPLNTRAVIDPTPQTAWTTTEKTEQLMANQQWLLQRANGYLSTLNFFGPNSPVPWTSIDGQGHQMVLLGWVDGSVTGTSNDSYFPDLSNVDVATIVSFVGAHGPPVGRLAVPHEFGHAFLATIRRQAALAPDLDNYLESGAISEALADLYSLAVMHPLGESPTWTCVRATASGTCSRDVRNPPGFGAPDRYLGPNYSSFAGTAFCTEANDHCEVHKNSTVLSHWGYLLALGSQGVPDPDPCGLALAPLDPSADLSFRRLLNINYSVAGTRLATSPSTDPTATFANFRDEALKVSQNMVVMGQAPDDTTRKLELAFYSVGLGPAFMTAPRNQATSDARDTPLDDSSSIYPWQTFSWPSNGDGQQSAEWDFQITDSSFDTPRATLKTSNSDTITRNGTSLASLKLALPFESRARFFWRVRPHSSDAWQGCYPVHSFVNTTTPAQVTGIRSSGSILPDGSVQPGNSQFSWDEVEGATSYRVFIATHPTNCQGGPGVIQAQNIIGVVPVSGLQPEEIYSVSVLPIGPNDFAGNPSVGACATATFHTGQLMQPLLDEPIDTGLYDYHGTSHPTFSWTTFDDPDHYRLQFYDIDESGNCTSNLRPNSPIVQHTCTNGCADSFSDDVLVPRNPSGYCWNVVSIAQNNRDRTSETRHIYYGHRSIRKTSPGLQIHDGVNGIPAPIAGDSYGKQTSFNWVSDADVFSYVVKVAPWPWNQTIATDPPNCVFVENTKPGGAAHPPGPIFGCNGGSVRGAHYQTFPAGSTGTIDGDVSSKGRYCWTMWPLVEDPLSPGTRSPRQPFVDVNPFFCYTSGPAKPEIQIDNRPKTTSFSSAPITGRIKIAYVPDMQLEVTGSPQADFEFNYDDCKADDRTALFDDRYDCVVEFNAASHESTDYSIRVRTWNSDVHPPKMDATTIVHDVVETFKTIACGKRGEGCCDSKCDPGALVCQADTCVDCGSANQACCSGNTCSNASLACQGGKCVTCGNQGQACCTAPNVDQCVRAQCPTGNCSDKIFELACQGGSCASCGNVGETCCPIGGVVDRFSVCAASGTVKNGAGSGVAAANCVANKCVACGQPGQQCCNGTICTAGSTCSNGTCSGVTPPPGVDMCNQMLHQGGNTAEEHVIQLGKTSGTTFLSVNTFTVPDEIQVFYEDRLLFPSGCFGTVGRFGCDPTGQTCCSNSGDGNCTVRIPYSGSSTTMTVRVIPNCEGDPDTQWVFGLSCP